MNYKKFEEFCGGPFWVSSLLTDNSWPQFTLCFISTVLVWVPCGYVWLLLPYFLYEVNNAFSTNNLYPLHANIPGKITAVQDNIKGTSIPGNCTTQPRHGLKSPRGKFSAVCVTKIVLTCLLAVISLVQLLINVKDNQPVAEILSSVVYLATYMLVCFQLWYERRKCRIAMFISFYFYTMNITLSIISVYTWILSQNYQQHIEQFSLEIAGLGINCLCFVLTFVPDNPLGNLMDSETSPEAFASYPSKLFYLWLLKLIITAIRKEITFEDVFNLNPRDQVRRLNPLFEHQWEDEVKRVSRINEVRFSNTTTPSDSDGLTDCTSDTTKNQANGSHIGLTNGHGHQTGKMEQENTSLLTKGGYKSFGVWTHKSQMQPKTPNLFRVLCKLHSQNIVKCFTQKIVSDFILFSGPVILGVIVERLQYPGEERAWQAYTLCGLLLVTIIIRSFLFSHSKYTSTQLAIHVKTMLVTAIYKKALSMCNSAKKSHSVGQIVNLMSVDCHRLQEYLADLSFVMTVPIQMVLSLVLLYTSIGPSMVAGVCVLILTVPINTWIVRRQKITQENVIKLKDQRTHIVNETLNSIKVLKLYGWEDEFKRKIEMIRSSEIEQLYKISTLFAISETIMQTIPFVCSVASFTTYVLIDRNNVLDAKTAFVSLALFNLLRLPVLSLKILVNYIIQITVSLTRINAFLRTPNLDITNTKIVSEADHAISITDGTFTWDSNFQPTLLNINASIASGKLTAIVGAVGSGKSSLISAILGEMDKIRGQVTVKGTVAYVSQQAWIQNATVKDNILFGKKFNRHRYMQVIKACELERDLEILEAGDQTEIGEKGINLSGGQKQRVSLARALYSDSDIYLFDDPLSAVDSHVGKAIFRNVISNKGMITTKTRVLVTHGIHWLSQVDHIIVLSKGIISEQGGYDELIARNRTKFLQTSHIENNSQSEDSDVSSSDEDEDEPMESVIRMTKSNTPGAETKMCDNADKPSWGVTMCQENGGDFQQHTSLINESVDCTMADIKEQRGKLTVLEELRTGRVTTDVFLTLGRAAGPIALFIAFMFFVVNRALFISSSFFLSKWTKDTLLQNATLRVTPEGENMLKYYLAMFGALFGISQLLTVAAYNYLFWNRMVRASHTLHHVLLDRLVHAPMTYFDQTPTGRILSRVSKDVDTVDSVIPICMNDVLYIGSSTVVVIIIVLIQSPIIAVVLFPLCIVFYVIQKYHRRTVRQLKRIESITRSPILTHLSESCTGSAIIRAYRTSDRFIDEFEKKVEKNVIYFFTNVTAYSWLQLAMDTLSSFVLFFAAVFLIADGGEGSDVGLSVSNTIMMSYSLTYLLRQFSEVESSIVAVERIQEYSQIEQEAALVNPDKRPSQSWPTIGDVTFSEYSTRYREGLELVLKGITCHINGGEKIGIVGRTGAGKSSLTLSLFRIIEAVSGAIIIDGINIADIGLHDLRNKLTVLPQDPVIFSGSLRSNIDPFEQYTDDQLWTALERSHLKPFVIAQASGLSFDCGHDGSNLSAGQRQLICLARALLRHTKILILDEATASVDMETDALIQKTVKLAFNDCTIIAIAHRLNTIMDYDRIIVMDNGNICEFDTPQNLLNTKQIFYSMCRDAGLV